MASRIRDAVLIYQETMTDTQTKILDLDGLGMISSLNFEVHCTNGASGNEDNFIHDILTKVEVVDGSDTIISLNGAQLQCMEYYKKGRLPGMFPSEWNSGQQREQFNIFFGRRLWDPEYGFDPAKYSNPQLKVTFNKAAIRAAGATGFADANNIVLTVVAKIMEEGARFRGVLMQKEIYAYVSAASGQERFSLPRDYPYRIAFARFWEEGNDIDEICSDLKITCDRDKFILLDRKVKQLDMEAFALYGLQGYKHDLYRGGSFTARVVWNKEPSWIGTCKTPGTPRVVVPWAQWSSNFNGELYDVATPSLDSTTRQLTGLCHGHAPHASVPIFFGDLADDGFAWDPTRWGLVEVIADEDNADAVCQFVLEQVRPQ